MAELFGGCSLAMATGVLCICIVLVLLFGDFVQPVTVLVALVPSVPEAFLALFVTGSAVSIPSMIGLITSTFLSLLVVPVVYTYVDDAIEWLRAGVATQAR